MLGGVAGVLASRARDAGTLTAGSRPEPRLAGGSPGRALPAVAAVTQDRPAAAGVLPGCRPGVAVAGIGGRES